MTSWFTKSLLPPFFRTAQRSVQALPASLLRIRPFGVYEIRLPRCVTEHSQPDANSPCQVRWIASQDEARCLGEIATAENIADWDGKTRRAIALWKNDKPVGVAWIAAESFAEEELGLHYRLADDEVWLFASGRCPCFAATGPLSANARVFDCGTVAGLQQGPAHLARRFRWQHSFAERACSTRCPAIGDDLCGEVPGARLLQSGGAGATHLETGLGVAPSCRTCR